MRRKLLTAVCLASTLLALYSCSMRAAVETDGLGHVVRVAALRVESSFPRVAVATLVAGGRLALELRWTRTLAPTSVPST